MMTNGRAPILIVWDSDTPHRFSGYITEILHIEGYNWFEVHDIARVNLDCGGRLQDATWVFLTHIDPVRGGAGPAALVRARRRQPGSPSPAA